MPMASSTPTTPAPTSRRQGRRSQQERLPARQGWRRHRRRRRRLPRPLRSQGSGSEEERLPARQGRRRRPRRRRRLPRPAREQVRRSQAERCPDKDGDAILDADDACPDAAGPANPANKKKHGCPPDKDEDGVPDAVDACPAKKGPASEDPKKNGCPAIAVLRKDSIVILQQVQFDTAKATIRKVSDKLLGEVATILRDHPEIALVSIEGHTDDRGSEKLNRDLSRRRAEAVKSWLVKKGKIDPSRLTAAGFGPDRPIDTNKTEKGRQKNRRVEFKIVPKEDPLAPLVDPKQ
jgi:outer membrane protein OmpA-like peptidoglycan-associated protein